MANFSSTALLSQSDMQSILSAVKTYIDKQVELANGDTTEVANLLNAIIGSDKAAALADQKTVRAISAEEVAKIVAGADTKYDTLKEIADWILSDTTGAAKMASDILTLQGYVGVPGDSATGLFKAIADETTRAMAAEKAAEDHSDANLVTAKSYADTKKSEAISAAAEDATSKVNTLSGTAVSATHTDDGVTVTLGGTVGAPTVTVAVDMCTEAQLKDLTDLFAIA